MTTATMAMPKRGANPGFAIRDLRARETALVAELATIRASLRGLGDTKARKVSVPSGVPADLPYRSDRADYWNDPRCAAEQRAMVRAQEAYAAGCAHDFDGRLRTALEEATRAFSVACYGTATRKGVAVAQASRLRGGSVTTEESAAWKAYYRQFEPYLDESKKAERVAEYQAADLAYRNSLARTGGAS